MTDIVIVRKGSMTQPSKVALRQSGVVVVEVHDLADCRLVRETEGSSDRMLLTAALDALSRDFGYGNTGEKQREQFTLNVVKAVTEADRD